MTTAVALTVVAGPAPAVTPERVVSPGGIEAWFIRDSNVPLVSMEFSFAGGSGADPAGKEGVANIAASLLEQGAGDLDFQAYQGKLEDLSISLGFSAGQDHFRGNLRTLIQHRDEAFRLLRLALIEPRFDAEPLARVRDQTLLGLARSERQPREVANRVWYTSVFPDHPYGRTARGTAGSIRAIGRDDLVAFAKSQLAKDTLKIGVVGDIEPAELGRLLDSAFGALPPVAATRRIVEPKVESKGGVIVVERPIPQSVVMFGQPGPRRHDPDFMAAFVLNHIVGGGGFGSRLTAEIREKRGLAYGVGTYLSTPAQSGLWLGSVATENSRVGQSIELIREAWSKARSDGVSAEELADAKRFLTGSYALRFDNTRRIAGMLLGLQEERLAIDYFDKRNDLVEAVSLDDVRRVAARYLDAEALLFVIVGKPEGVKATRPVPDKAG